MTTRGGRDLTPNVHTVFSYYFGTPDCLLGSNIRDIELWSWLVALNE